MPSYATNVLPSTTGLNLGASNQEWNAWLNLLNGATPVNQSSQIIAFVSAPSFVTTTQISIFTMTLIGDVVSSTFQGVPGLVIFQLTQDATGNRSFTWPTNFNGGTSPQSDANSVTSQIFFYDGTTGWPLGPGVVWP